MTSRGCFDQIPTYVPPQPCNAPQSALGAAAVHQLPCPATHIGLRGGVGLGSEKTTTTTKKRNIFLRHCRAPQGRHASEAMGGMPPVLLHFTRETRPWQHPPANGSEWYDGCAAIVCAVARGVSSGGRIGRLGAIQYNTIGWAHCTLSGAPCALEEPTRSPSQRAILTPLSRLAGFTCYLFTPLNVDNIITSRTATTARDDGTSQDRCPARWHRAHLTSGRVPSPVVSIAIPARALLLICCRLHGSVCRHYGWRWQRQRSTGVRRGAGAFGVADTTGVTTA